MDFTLPMDQMLQHLFPWFGIISGPIASALFVQQWHPEPWMETSLHVVNAAAFLQLLYILLQHPELRWPLFSIATVQLLAWSMAWGWSSLELVSKFPTIQDALITTEGKNGVQYAHLTMAISFLALIGGILVSWSHAHHTLSAWVLVWMVIWVVLAGLLFFIFETPWETSMSTWSDPSDVLAIVNLAVGVYIIATFILGYRVDVRVDDLWRPILRWCFKVKPNLKMMYWWGALIFMGLLASIIFFSLMASLYMNYYRKNLPADRRKRVAAGSFGTLAVTCLFLGVTFVNHVGLPTLLQTFSSDEAHYRWMNEVLSPPAAEAEPVH